MSEDIKINNKDIYLDRMSKPLEQKLRVTEFFTENTKSVLDVGCANGILTLELAKRFPDIKFKGIDLEDSFVNKAQDSANSDNVKNVTFNKTYLRDLLALEDRFDAIIFVSVLHEFYSYGEGISSVLKALADAHELLNKKGRIIIRDMILSEYAKKSDINVNTILNKIKTNKEYLGRLKDFENYFGNIKNLKDLNHFLLKYMYVENWDRELKEEYVPVSFEEYRSIFSLLDMNVQFQDSYTLPFLRDKWKKDFNLSDQEVDCMRSTGLVVVEKNTR